MTIRRRLFLSNILMIIIPILLSILMTAILTNLILDRVGIELGFPQESNNIFYRTAEQMKNLSKDWESADKEKIQADMDSFDLEKNGNAVSIALYEGNKELYQVGNFTTSPLISLAREEDGNNAHYTMNNTALFTVKAGKYRVYLYNQDYENNAAGPSEPADQTINPGILIILLVLFAIAFTNGLLTKFVFRSITRPLNILVDGVHEIRDGNLNYRIDYQGKDEFAEVCKDFNEMAAQIQELMEARKKDDENRRELVAGISHDLRTPLTSIKTYAEGIAEGVATTPLLQKEYLETIIAKTDDLEHIVQQLFLFSKLDVGEFPFSEEVLDIGMALESFVNRSIEEYAADMTITFDNQGQQKYVEVDPVQLRTVFTNLLENSLKYGAKEHKQLLIQCFQAEDQITIVFEDNGPGVPEDSLDKLFQVFYRGSKARTGAGKAQGNGLGLAISAKIIKRFSGTIYAENVPDSGLRTIITLPLLEGIENG